MNKKNATKKISENNQIPLLVCSGQWQVVERTEEYIYAVCPKNRQDDRIDEQKKLIDQLTKKLRSQDKQMTEQKECIRSQDAKIKSQDIRINLQDEQIKEMHECICSQNEQIQDQNKLITELQAKWESQEERLILINQSKETGQVSNSKQSVLMADTYDVDVRGENFVFGSKIKRKEISAIYTQNTLQNIPSDAWDVSAGKDRSVMAWTCKDTDSDTHTLYLAGDGEIYANPDSSYLFTKYEGLTKADFTHLKTDLVTNMGGMFENCSQLQVLDVSNWDVSNVTSMSGMFCGCSQLQVLDVSKWNVSNVTDMVVMFLGCSQLQALDVSNWDVSNVTDMERMFLGCSQLQALDVSNWDVSNVTDMRSMFSSCNAANSMKEGELSSWKLHPSVNLENFCEGTKFEKTPTALFEVTEVISLGEQSVTIDQNKETEQASIGKLAVLMADTCNVNKESFVFGSKIKRKEISAIYTQNTLQNVPSDAWDVSAGKDRSVMAWTCKDTDSDTHTLYLAGDGEIYANPDSSYLFTKYEGLTKADFTHLKTDMVTNMTDMFLGCSQLQVLDVSNWDVSNVEYMTSMFCQCSQLETLDVSKWNVSNVKNMQRMFSGCSQLQALDVSKWDVSNVKNMWWMFSDCSQLQALDVSKWDVSNVEYMWRMFANCSQLQDLDVSKWNVSNATNMVGMFLGCSQLQALDVSNWDVSNVTDMERMFSSCNAVNSMKEGELSSWKLHPSVNLENFCRGTKFEKTPTALFKNRGQSLWESLKSSLK